jgi:predicted transcriptional regulator
LYLLFCGSKQEPTDEKLPGTRIWAPGILQKGGQEVNVKELVQRFNLHVAAGQKQLDRRIQGGYCGDLLSDVMANAPDGCIWMTVQTHQNIVSVAVLHEMAAIVLTGGHTPDPETIDKAEAEGIPILLWPNAAFELAGQVYEAGVAKS